MADNLRYKWLKLRLEEDILNDYRPNDRFMSQREIMSRYEASYSTVERALRELVDSGVLVRIHGKGTFVCERKPYGDGSRKLALVMSENVIYAPKYFYAEVLMQLTATLSSRGYSFVFIYTGNYEWSEPLIPRLTMGGENFVGAILVGATDDALIETLHERRFPIVLVDRMTGIPGIPYVATDNQDGAFRAVSHLIEHGHRNIGFVSTPLHTSLLERYEGFCNALAEHGLKINREWCLKDLRLDHPEEDLDPFLSRLPRPSAIFAANDAIAVRCINRLHALNIPVPSGISVIGFDGNYISEHCQPPLSSMLVDTGRMGVVAGELMMQLLDGRKPAPELLATELLPRKSVENLHLRAREA
ncbi:MAG: GntR family transcriptional regulator [Lentisphaeria bacterium]|nr:GntR family transcriptional regulator [Lentisphaeria bacterium]